MYPDLFETAEAARKTLVRYEGLFTGHSPKINGTLRGMSGKTVFEINYRPAGRGQNLRQAIAAEWRLPGLRKLMGDKIGLMKQFDVEELPEPPEPPDNPPPPSPSATTPPPTPTPPSPDDGDAPVFEQDDPGWTADPWHQAKPPDDDGLAWDEVAEGTADDG